jgi:lipid-binding SYLF domain-containing protein
MRRDHSFQATCLEDSFMRLRTPLFSVLALVTLAWAAGCSTEPKTEAHREALQADGKATLQSMAAIDPGLQNVTQNSYAYIVFPDIGKGGFLIGGAWGRGVVYEQGRFVGYASVAEGSVGATAGGQTFSELIVFNSREAFRKFQSNRLSFGADASAVALKAGAAASAEFRNNVAVFVSNQGGLMVDASVKGQNIGFVPADQAD